MSTTFFLVRHALCDPVGKSISGRMPGVHLNSEGKAQALDLATRLEGSGVSQIFSSPLERALETAHPVSEKLGTRVQKLEALNEIDFGEFSGRSLAELNQDEDWRRYHAFRSGQRAPRGESMAEVCSRVVGALDRLKEEFPGKKLALFSHADVIRGTLLYFLGAPAEFMQRIEIRPASVSVLHLGPYGPLIETINDTRTHF